MREIPEFLWAVTSYWVVLMSGIASVLIALWLKAKRQSDIAANSFWIIGIVCVFLAFFFAWRDEHQLRKSAQASLYELSVPRLQAHIDQIEISHFPEHSSMVLLWVSIRNLGADSIADVYRLKATLPNGSNVDLFLAILPQYIVFTELGLRIDTSQGALYDKTAEQPIPRGGSKTGMLMFLSDTDSPETLRKVSTKFTLSFNDVLGKTAMDYYTMRDANERPRYIPGAPKFGPVTRDKK